jgi:ERCC4-type nuclease
MIYLDISEQPRVHKAFSKAFGSEYQKKQLGIWDCIEQNFPFPTFCISTELEDKIAELMKTFKYDGNKCNSCDSRQYVRFADIEIGESRAYYERKTAKDFAISMKNRLPLQMEAMDTFIQDGHKGIILEGLADYKYIEDGFFSALHDEQDKLSGMSPLQQAIQFSGGKKGWVLSFIKECKMRGIEFVQTYNLEETIDFIDECDKGFGQEPKLRLIPKRYPRYPLEQNILALFKGCGKERSKQILEKNERINEILSMLKEEMKKYKFVTEWKKKDDQRNKI